MTIFSVNSVRPASYLSIRLMETRKKWIHQWPEKRVERQPCRLQADSAKQRNCSGKNHCSHGIRWGKIFFIPTSGRSSALTRILPQLTNVLRSHPHFDMHLFGYPEWQTYTKDHLEAFLRTGYILLTPRSTRTICCRQPLTSPRATANGMARRWTNVIPNSACWVSTRATSSSKDCRATVRDLKRTWTKWTCPHSDRLQVPACKQLGRIYQPESVLCTLHQEFRTDKARLWLRKTPYSHLVTVILNWRKWN